MEHDHAKYKSRNREQREKSLIAVAVSCANRAGFNDYSLLLDLDIFSLSISYQR